MDTLVIMGSGSLARSVCYSLAAIVSRPTAVTVLARSPGTAELCHVAGARAAATRCPVTFTPVISPLEQGTIRGVLADLRPDGLLLCASLQSPWERTVAPSPWTDLIGAAGFGVTLPLQAELALRTGHALRRASPRTWYLNACFPDAVNGLLVALGVPVLAGIGNVAILAVGLAAALGLPGEERLALLAHHFHLHPPGDPGEEARAWCDGTPVPGLAGLLAAIRSIDRPELNHVTGHTAAVLLRALLAGQPVDTHLPGPGGRPGGYPVRAHPEGVTLRLPPGVTEAEAVSANQGWSARDGVVLDGDRVRFGPAASAALRRHLPHLADGFDVGDTAAAAAGLRELRDRLRRGPAAAHPARSRGERR